jgi:RNA polymerase sigma-70 factor (ECF subfamily)
MALARVFPLNAASATEFDAIVARHRPDVLRVCRSILHDDHLVADAAQETFLRLWKRRVDGRAPEHASAWLRRVAVSAALDVARARARRSHDSALEGPLAESLADPRPEAASEHAGAADAELRDRFRCALDELSEGQRTVFLLRHEGNLPLSEVAEALGVSLPTVKTQFARACSKLQQKLAAFRPEDPSP